jgi:hypothetical protein
MDILLNRLGRDARPVGDRHRTVVAAYDLGGPRIHQRQDLTSRRGDPLMGVQRLLNELRDLLTAGDDPAVSFVCSAVEVMLAVRAGRLAEATALARVFTDAEPTAGNPGAQTRHWTQETAAPQRAGSATCRREGVYWRFELAGRSVVVKHAVGMLHLAVLLANPGTEVPSVELAAGVAALARRNTSARLSDQPVLDRAAIQQYRQRLEVLRTGIERLESGGQPNLAAEARAEHAWLTAELAAATGLSGRTRRFSDSQERARLAVGRAIRRAVARIAHEDPAFGEHLRHHVRTGVRCVYHADAGSHRARHQVKLRA